MIIKCPECGRQVSEKAPTCPNCGVEIAGKITRCSNCGEVYFTEDGICPVCQEPNRTATRPNVYAQPTTGQQTTTAGPADQQPTTKPAPPKAPEARRRTGGSGESQQEEKTKGKTWGTVLVALIFALIVCGALFYFYNRAQTDKESEDYEFAMRSTDPAVLQSYLLRYSDAPSEHRDSIQAHLQLLQKSDEDWQNAVLSNSREALRKYVEENPESVHRQEALNKIDSLDWLAASKSAELDAVQNYLREHSDGRYIDDAKALMEKLVRAQVQPSEQAVITSLFRQFFQSINSRDQARLTETVGMVINFLGKSDATRDDVVTYMNKLYKDDVANLIWRIDNQTYTFKKTEVAENEFEYDVTFNARKEVEHTSGEKSSESYSISAKVSDGKISSMRMTKLTSAGN